MENKVKENENSYLESNEDKKEISQEKKLLSKKGQSKWDQVKETMDSIEWTYGNLLKGLEQESGFIEEKNETKDFKENFLNQERIESLNAKVAGMQKAVVKLLSDAEIKEKSFANQMRALKEENENLKERVLELQNNTGVLDSQRLSEQKQYKDEIDSLRQNLKSAKESKEKSNEDFEAKQQEVQKLKEELESFSKKRKNIRLYAKWLEMRSQKFTEKFEEIIDDFSEVASHHPFRTFHLMIEKEIENLDKKYKQTPSFNEKKQINRQKKYLQKQQSKVLKVLEKSSWLTQQKAQEIKESLEAEDFQDLKKYILFKD